MSRRPARFTEADINRALKAAGKCKYPVTVDILPDGTIRLARYQPPVESGDSDHNQVENDYVIEL